MSYAPIEDHGVIGDLHTVALVSSTGSIDFMCFPRFDSPSVFAALLDHRRGGRFAITPMLEDARAKQIYLPDSNVLLTRALSDEGVAEVSDFMPIDEGVVAHDVVRRAKSVRSEVRFRMVCDPRFDYGRAEKSVDRQGNDVVFQSRGADGTALRLRASVPLEVRDGAAVAEFELCCDQHAWFVLEDADPKGGSPSARPEYVSESFKRTLNFWRTWLARCRYRGRWQEIVHRSALTLKLLCSDPLGSLVAAPTFGLPEHVGGLRNWDYRYTWIRDASMALSVLMRLGYFQEANKFMDWLVEHCIAHAGDESPNGPLQVMYGIDGRADLHEEILTHLEGYRGTKPVRIGNGAARQLQLDIYGELLAAVDLYDDVVHPIAHDFWTSLVSMLDWVTKNWRRRDHGIWEVRGELGESLHSRAMCWLAIDRALHLARRRSLPAPVALWVETRDDIWRDLHERFWNQELGAFTHRPGTEMVDASCLLLPIVEFIGGRDPRWVGTLRQVTDQLVEDSLVRRYSTDGFDDGVGGKEGTFSMCSFWYVGCLARTGDLEQARFVFEKLLGYASHLGLYSEELGPRREHLGNFPQALTHLSLIQTALDLDRRLSTIGPLGRA